MFCDDVAIIKTAIINNVKPIVN